MDTSYDPEYYPEIAECDDACIDRPAMTGGDFGPFLKGMIVGFGLAAVATVFYDLFREQRRRRLQSGSSFSRRRDGDLLGGLTGLVDEGRGAFRDAVDARDRTFDSGTRAVQSVQDVVGKCVGRGD
jgi:hypothetical protein